MPYKDKEHEKKHRQEYYIKNSEKFIGRQLTTQETVHHINKNRQDNRIENLMLFPTNSAHQKFHTKLRQVGLTNPILRQIEKRWEQ